jgi:hypothetical protein
MKLRTLVAAAVMAMSGLSSANILVNGSFELGTFPTGRIDDGGALLAAGSTNLTGWNVVAPVDWLQTFTVAPNAFSAWGLSPRAGDYFLDITGFDTNGTTFGKIEQTFPVQPLTTYIVEFWLGTSLNSTLNNGSATALVTLANGVNVLTATQAADSSLPWTKYTTSFTTLAGDSQATIGFQGTSGFNYIGLDNVTVTAVPEPGSIALMLAGLAAVGSVAARRRPQR